MRVTNNIGIVAQIREFCQSHKVTSPFGRLWVIFKYFFIYDLIPNEKEFILKLVPLNRKLLDFVFILMQVRQQYKHAKSKRIKDLARKMFPTLFFISGKVLTKNEIDTLSGRLNEVMYQNVKKNISKRFRRKAKL